MLLARVRNPALLLAVVAFTAISSPAHAGRFSDMVGGGLNAARSVGGRAANRASQGLGAAQNVARRGTDVARTAASRSVGVARSAASQGAVVARSAAVRGVGAAHSVATRGVIIAGSAANRARLAQGAIQNRLANGAGLQNVAGVGANGAVAAGVARFAGATQIAAGAPQGIIAANGAGVQQLRASVANRTQNVLNAAASIPPRVVGGAGRVAQAVGLPALPPRLKQAVDDAASLPQLAANIPVGAIVKSKVRELGGAVGQGQVMNNVATAGQQALAGSGLVGDALQVAGQIQQAAIGPANAVANNEGLIGEEIAGGIVQTVDAAQPDLLALPIPTGVRSIVANRPVSGGMAMSSPVNESLPMDVAPIEEAVETFASPVAAISNADLALEDIQLAAHATAIAGPAYRLQFRNQGSSEATDFYVVLLAGVGSAPAEDAPRAVLHVANVPPGEAVEAILRLPAAAMQMTDVHGNPAELTHVFVSLDFADSVPEIDETNNLAIVEAAVLTTAMR